jgi:hypothetical protein
VSTKVPASLAGRKCELIDISVTGALMSVDMEPEMGSQHAFELGEDDETLDLVGRVVRVKPTYEQGRWHVAVAFVDVTLSTQRAISSTVARLMAAPPRRLPGHGGA